MRLAIVLVLSAAGTCAAQPLPPAPPIAARVKAVEDKVSAHDQQIAELKAQNAAILAALSRIEARSLVPEVTPNAIPFVKSDGRVFVRQCDGNQCRTIQVMPAQPAGVVSTSSTTFSPGAVVTYTGAGPTGPCGSTNNYGAGGGCGTAGAGWYPGKLLGRFGAKFGGCGG